MLRESSERPYTYFATTSKPTSVRHVLSANFTSPHETNAIVSKGTYLSVFTLEADKLCFLIEHPIYGVISCIESYRPQNRSTDLVLLITEENQFCVLSYDAPNKRVKSESTGTLQDFAAPLTKYGHFCSVDPTLRCIGAHLFRGKLQFLRLETSALGKARQTSKALQRLHGPQQRRVGDVIDLYNIKMPESGVRSLVFLYNCMKPTAAVICEEGVDCAILRTYSVDFLSEDLSPGTGLIMRNQRSVESGANMLIPIPGPYEGIVVVGNKSISYYSPSLGDEDTNITFKINEPTIMLAQSAIGDDGKRYLLTDAEGILYVLVLLADSISNKITAIGLTRLGKTSVASSIAYLDNGFAYIGSRFENSMLIQMRDSFCPQNLYIDIVEQYTNIGPIFDFCMVDLENNGQRELVACSGGIKGSLCIMRNGVEITKHSCVEMEGIKSIWPLRSTCTSNFTDMLLVSFYGETRLLRMKDDVLEELEKESEFIYNETTLAAGNANLTFVYQVCKSRVRLIDLSGSAEFRVIAEWRPEMLKPDDGTHIGEITAASVNCTRAVLALSNGILVHLRFSMGEILQMGFMQSNTEISCLNVNGAEPDECCAPLCVIGLWKESSVRIVNLDKMEVVSHTFLDGEVVPRSVLMVSFEGICFLLAALGDGQMYSFVINPSSGALSDRKKVTLGTQPVTLATFTSGGTVHVFALSDRLTVISSNGDQKLSYSNVDVTEMRCMCPFDNALTPNCIAYATQEGLTLATVDQIQKQHIRVIPIPTGEVLNKICYQKSSSTVGLCTTLYTANQINSKKRERSSYFRILRSETYLALDIASLDSTETAQCLTNVELDGDEGPYFAIGTSYIAPLEDIPTSGRLLLFQVGRDQKLNCKLECHQDGSVNGVCSSNGRVFVLVNSKILVYQRTATDGPSLTLLATFDRNTFALDAIVVNDVIVVADLMRSITLLQYDPVVSSVREVAEEKSGSWITAMELLDEDTVLAADQSGNVLVTEKISDVEKHRSSGMQVIPFGHYRYGGGLINRIRKGSIVTSYPGIESLAQVAVTFATTDGAIGVVAQITREQYEFLRDVQRRLLSVINVIGDFDHTSWRTFRKESIVSDSSEIEESNCIDGDLIESFLDLDQSSMEKVVRGLNNDEWTVDGLTRMIQELVRIH